MVSYYIIDFYDVSYCHYADDGHDGRYFSHDFTSIDGNVGICMDVVNSYAYCVCITIMLIDYKDISIIDGNCLQVD